MIFDQFEKALTFIGGKVLSSIPNKHNFDMMSKTSELTVTHKPKPPNNIRYETRQSLNDMTKQQICSIASERYGIDLNQRTEKKLLISQFLDIQNNHTGAYDS